ncbi:MAG: T9SS type A sorting domain-containing protein [Flavobacteriales bacterium]
MAHPRPILRDNTMLDNGAAKIMYGTNSGSPEFYLRTDATTNVQNGQWYEMRFSMQSTMHGVVRAEFKGQSQAAGPNAIFSKSIPFDTQRRDISLVFQSTLSEPGLFIFANNFNESTYWLDNVELYRVTVEAVDPYTRHILLTNETNSAVDVPLTGCWRDVQGALHNTSIALPAWGSVVLAKEDDELCGLSTGVQEDSDVASDAPVLYPNPVRSGAPLSLSQAVDSRTEMEIIDASGRSVQLAQLNAGTVELPINGQLPSGHYVILLRNNGFVQRHRVVVQ